MSRWFEDGTESTDPHDMFWYQDDEMASLTRARYRESYGKKMQYLTARINGKMMEYNPDRHIKLEGQRPGDEFTVEPVFTDERHTAQSENHAAVRPRVTILSGPVIQTGEYTFRYDPAYFGKDPARLWSGITLCLEADGDDTYKSAVQELNLK